MLVWRHNWGKLLLKSLQFQSRTICWHFNCTIDYDFFLLQTNKSDEKHNCLLQFDLFVLYKPHVQFLITFIIFSAYSFFPHILYSFNLNDGSLKILRFPPWNILSICIGQSIWISKQISVTRIKVRMVTVDPDSDGLGSVLSVCVVTSVFSLILRNSQDQMIH